MTVRVRESIEHAAGCAVDAGLSGLAASWSPWFPARVFLGALAAIYAICAVGWLIVARVEHCGEHGRLD